jgi:hypothetical protein
MEREIITFQQALRSMHARPDTKEGSRKEAEGRIANGRVRLLSCSPQRPSDGAR